MDENSSPLKMAPSLNHARLEGTDEDQSPGLSSVSSNEFPQKNPFGAQDLLDAASFETTHPFSSHIEQTSAVQFDLEITMAEHPSVQKSDLKSVPSTETSVRVPENSFFDGEDLLDTAIFGKTDPFSKHVGQKPFGQIEQEAEMEDHIHHQDGGLLSMSNEFISPPQNNPFQTEIELETMMSEHPPVQKTDLHSVSSSEISVRVPESGVFGTEDLIDPGSFETARPISTNDGQTSAGLIELEYTTADQSHLRDRNLLSVLSTGYSVPVPQNNPFATEDLLDTASFVSTGPFTSHSGQTPAAQIELESTMIEHPPLQKTDCQSVPIVEHSVPVPPNNPFATEDLLDTASFVAAGPFPRHDTICLAEEGAEDSSHRHVDRIEEGLNAEGNYLIHQQDDSLLSASWTERTSPPPENNHFVAEYAYDTTNHETPLLSSSRSGRKSLADRWLDLNAMVEHPPQLRERATKLGYFIVDRPRSAAHGMMRAVYNIMKGFIAGVTLLITSPFYGASNEMELVVDDVLPQCRAAIKGFLQGFILRGTPGFISLVLTGFLFGSYQLFLGVFELKPYPGDGRTLEDNWRRIVYSNSIDLCSNAEPDTYYSELTYLIEEGIIPEEDFDYAGESLPYTYQFFMTDYNTYVMEGLCRLLYNTTKGLVAGVVLLVSAPIVDAIAKSNELNAKGGKRGLVGGIDGFLQGLIRGISGSILLAMSGAVLGIIALLQGVMNPHNIAVASNLLLQAGKAYERLKEDPILSMAYPPGYGLEQFILSEEKRMLEEEENLLEFRKKRDEYRIEHNLYVVVGMEYICDDMPARLYAEGDDEPRLFDFPPKLLLPGELKWINRAKRRFKQAEEEKCRKEKQKMKEGA